MISKRRNNTNGEMLTSPHAVTEGQDGSPRMDSHASLNDSIESGVSLASSVDFEEMLKEQRIVYIQNQYKGVELIPLTQDLISNSDDPTENLILETNSDKSVASTNFKTICKIIEKVSADADVLSRKLRGLKENTYDTTIQWSNDEYLHKVANLQTEESTREMILLKKKKLERIRRDMLNVKNLQDEEDPELFLSIKQIEFRENREVLKTFFAAIDLIVYKNSGFSFDWAKFVARVFRNKETMDAYLYRMKYFPFNEMTDYHLTLCKKYTEEDQEFLQIFEETELRKVPFEIFIVKPFVEWMKVMKYGYELNQELIVSIKRINTTQFEVDKLYINIEILKKRLDYSNRMKEIIGKQLEFLTKQLETAKQIKQALKKKYNFE